MIENKANKSSLVGMTWNCNKQITKLMYPRALFHMLLVKDIVVDIEVSSSSFIIEIYCRLFL